MKNEKDWPRMQPTFTYDLWKVATNQEYFTRTVHWVGDKVGEELELKWRVVTTYEVLEETISTTGES